MYIILTFRSWKKILKIFFLPVTRLILEKKYFLAIFRICSQKKKKWHNDFIILKAAILGKKFLPFFCNITSMTARFHVKSIFLPGFMQEGVLSPPPPHPPHDQTKICEKWKKDFCKINFCTNVRYYIGVFVNFVS